MIPTDDLVVRGKALADSFIAAIGSARNGIQGVEEERSYHVRNKPNDLTP